MLKQFSGFVGGIGLIKLLTDVNLVELDDSVKVWLQRYNEIFEPIANFLFGWIFVVFRWFHVELPEGTKHYFLFAGIIGGAISASLIRPPDYLIFGGEGPKPATDPNGPKPFGKIKRVTVNSHVTGWIKRLTIGPIVYFPVALVVAPFVFVFAIISALGYRSYFLPSIRIMFDTVVLALLWVIAAVVVNHVLLQTGQPPQVS